MLIIAIIKVGIGVFGAVLAVMQAFANYDKTKAGFNDAVVDCKAFVEKIRYRVSEFFGGFGHSPGAAGA